MALLEKQLYVKPSILPGSGNGLYTTKFIPKGTRIVEYKGKITTWKECDHKDGKNGYIYYVKRYHVIDALDHTKALARYANDAAGLGKVKGVSNNCHYVEEGLRVFIKSIKDIPAGSEILVKYGTEYWEVIRYNMRLEKKQEKERVSAGKAGPGKVSPGKAKTDNAKTGKAKTGKTKTDKTKTTKAKKRKAAKELTTKQAKR